MEVEPQLRVVDEEDGSLEVEEEGPEPSRLARIRERIGEIRWRQILTTIGEMAGICLISGGFAMKWPWIGVIISGVLLILFCVALSLPVKGDDG